MDHPEDCGLWWKGAGITKLAFNRDDKNLYCLPGPARWVSIGVAVAISECVSVFFWMIKNGRSCNEIFIRQGGMQTFSALRLAFALCSMCLIFEIA